MPCQELLTSLVLFRLVSELAIDPLDFPGLPGLTWNGGYAGLSRLFIFTGSLGALWIGRWYHTCSLRGQTAYSGVEEVRGRRFHVNHRIRMLHGRRDRCMSSRQCFRIIVLLTSHQVTLTFLEGSNVDYNPEQVSRLSDAQIGRVVYGSKMQLVAWYTYVTLM